jgi:hypothetical protein
MGGKSTKKGAAAGEAADNDASSEVLDGQVMERLSLSMREAKVICRRPSEVNGDILIEELLDSSGGTTVRRMRFCSNLVLEQTEVRLFKWCRLVPKARRSKGAGGAGVSSSTGGVGTVKKGAASSKAPGGWDKNPFRILEDVKEREGGAEEQHSSSEEEVEVLVADSNYLPYECMQGMCLSFALLPLSSVEQAIAEPLSICVTGLAGGMLPRFIRHNFPRAEIDCVEIDQAVADVAVEMLGFKPDKSLRVHVADGIDFMAAAPDASYDINIIDVNASDDDKTLEASNTHACELPAA